MALLIRQATVVQPASRFHNHTVDILINEGVIQQIGNGIDAGNAEIFEHPDLMVSAGWVDVLADYREPGYEQKETIQTGLAAAANGGFTDVLLAPNTAPVTDTKGGVQYALQQSSGNAVTLHPLGAISKGAEGKTLAEMMDMRANGAVAFTDGWNPVQSSQLLLKALEYVKGFDGLVIQLPNDAALSAGGLMHEGELSTRLGMAGIPSIAESLFVHRDIELLRYTASRLHITGVSTAESIDLIRKAKAEGLSITCSATPYHIALTDESLARYSSQYKVTPPLRSEADRQAVIEGLFDGTIDCIATHHRPQDWDAKEKEFEYAGEGMAIQESAFGILMEGLGNGKQQAPELVDIEQLVAALSTNPRHIFGLAPGLIDEGAATPLTFFSITGTSLLSRNEAESLAYNNPFLDRALPGAVVAIYSNNQFKKRI